MFLSFYTKSSQSLRFICTHNLTFIFSMRSIWVKIHSTLHSTKSNSDISSTTQYFCPWIHLRWKLTVGFLGITFSPTSVEYAVFPPKFLWCFLNSVSLNIVLWPFLPAFTWNHYTLHVYPEVEYFSIIHIPHQAFHSFQTLFELSSCFDSTRIQQISLSPYIRFVSALQKLGKNHSKPIAHIKRTPKEQIF